MIAIQKREMKSKHKKADRAEFPKEWGNRGMMKMCHSKLQKH